jgi:glycosyltransferase involved in cell wall biosynthesis
MTSPSSGIESSGRGEFAEGVSVIVCARNAASRIGRTLLHLAQQEAVPVPWEVIVVDNNSTDGTVEAARKAWPANAPAPLRLLSEPTLGYNHAAERGIANARYSIIAHVHDDNWLEKNWIAQAAAIFRSDPEIGACGGRVEAGLECKPPWWFAATQHRYAVGPQGEQSGDVTWSRGYLWGAGLCVRRTAWEKLEQEGFRFLTSGRKASGKIISGEDSEICYALRLAGWKLYYSEDLRLTHYIPAARLNWRYLTKLVRSFGAASALHDCYIYPLSHERLNEDRIWWNALKQSVRRLVGMRRSWFALVRESEGNTDLLLLQRQIARTLELVRLRNTYAQIHRAVFHAAWRRMPRA